MTSKNEDKMKRIKKTFELDEDVVSILEGMSKYFDMTQLEIIEMAVLQPKIYITSLRIYDSIKGKNSNA